MPLKIKGCNLKEQKFSAQYLNVKYGFKLSSNNQDCKSKIAVALSEKESLSEIQKAFYESIDGKNFELFLSTVSNIDMYSSPTQENQELSRENRYFHEVHAFSYADGILVNTYASTKEEEISKEEIISSVFFNSFETISLMDDTKTTKEECSRSIMQNLIIMNSRRSISFMINPKYSSNQSIIM